MPSRKVSVSGVAGAIIVLAFYVLTQTGLLHPDPPAAVGAAAVWIVGTILAYVIPEKDQAA